MICIMHTIQLFRYIYPPHQTLTIHMQFSPINKVYLRILSALLLLSFCGCKHTGGSLATTPNAPGLSAETIRPYILMTIPLDTTDIVFHSLNNLRATLHFYALNGRKSIWFNNNKPTLRADSLRSFLRNTRYYGLLRNNYHYESIERIIYQPEEALRCEILLTDAFLSIANDLKYGRRLYKDSAPHDSLSIVALQQALEQGRVKKSLHEQEPAFTEYRLLKTALQIAIDTLTAETRQLLLAGVIHDSIATQKEIQLVEVNLERWRRENLTYASRYIFINIPAFTLQVYDANKVMFESRVIVGTPDKQTPELSSSIECISIYPYWHVPQKIVIEEYLPIIQKDTTFLLRNNFEVLDRNGKILRRDSIDWKQFSANYFPVSLRQREGVENSLGVIKFTFDNPYAIYLHDTNAKRLFRNNVRAYSHGCIRLEKAEELAHYLVTGKPEERSKVIARYLQQKKQHIISLEDPMPIYIRYFTCEYANARLTKYTDIYRKDKAIARLLYNSATPVIVE